TTPAISQSHTHTFLSLDILYSTDCRWSQEWTTGRFSHSSFLSLNSASSPARLPSCCFRLLHSCFYDLLIFAYSVIIINCS
ncbi:hypothetical protein PHJA_002990500, partial [Phtheirospermum japonicum]